MIGLVNENCGGYARRLRGLCEKKEKSNCMVGTRWVRQLGMSQFLDHDLDSDEDFEDSECAADERWPCLVADVLPVNVAGNACEGNGDGKGDQGQNPGVLVASSFQDLPLAEQPKSFHGKEEAEEGARL